MRTWFAVLLVLLCTPAGAEDRKSDSKAGVLESIKQAALSARDRTADAAFTSMFGRCGNPCLMPADSHMLFWARAIAAAVALKNDTAKNRDDKPLVVINVPCRGECALFADIAFDHVCLGPKAEFKFFRVGGGDKAHFADPPFSKRVADWMIRKMGGKQEGGFVYPLVRDVKDAPTMGFEEAVQLGFWKACGPEILAKL
jgi:hypothetical protein